ncbi:UNVERIFIED_CONTAM: hypothetical protein Slati_2156100 [Sesamum latifolium]|uniref:SWIM-type domain-containing protein n=1 Tax=Sesamum latifolium TaxID=2727402 RepID=A0AAW2WQQ3_9LAMI
MSRIQVKKAGMEKYEGVICPNIIKKTGIQRKESRNCFPSWAGEDKYEVMHFMQNHIVYLKDRFCSCGMFQLVGYPCCHAIAALDYHRLEVEGYIDDFQQSCIYEAKGTIKGVAPIPHPNSNSHRIQTKADRGAAPHMLQQVQERGDKVHQLQNNLLLMSFRLIIQSLSQPSQEEAEQPQVQNRTTPVQSTSPTRTPQLQKQGAPKATRKPFKMPQQTRPPPVPVASKASHLNPGLEQPPCLKLPESNKDQFQPPVKLAKRKQVETPSQPTTFKRKCCSSTSMSSLIKGVANSYRPKQTTKQGDEGSGSSNPKETVK